MLQTGSAGARLLLRARKTTRLTACAARAEYISEALGRPGSPARSQPPPKVHNRHKMHPRADPRSLPGRVAAQAATVALHRPTAMLRGWRPKFLPFPATHPARGARYRKRALAARLPHQKQPLCLASLCQGARHMPGQAAPAWSNRLGRTLPRDMQRTPAQHLRLGPGASGSGMWQRPRRAPHPAPLSAHSPLDL